MASISDDDVQILEELETLKCKLEEFVKQIDTLQATNNKLAQELRNLQQERTTDQKTTTGPFCAWCGGRHLGLDCRKRVVTDEF